jgi:hypothetical protein
MLTWLLVNVGLSVLALVFITLNGSAPHRLRFCAGFVALAAWLVPWSLVPELMPDLFHLRLAQVEQSLTLGSARLTGVAPLVILATGAVPLTPDFLVFTLPQLLFIALGAIGFLLFLWNLGSHHARLRRLGRTSSDGNWLWQRAGMNAECPVLVQHQISGAFSSGLLRPRIWVHGDLVGSNQLPTRLRHELTHIRQHDNWYLLLITLVEKLLWWNPLVWYLGRSTRELQELSCDEQCQRSISDYPVRLAQLMLDSARAGSTPAVMTLSANIFSKPNPNIKRIKLLERSYTMKTRHLVSAAASVVIAILGIGLVTAQPDAPRAVAGERVMIFNGRIAGEAGEDVFVGAPLRTMHVTMGMNGPDGNVDQFIKVEGLDGDMLIAFSFTDTPLPVILTPLADMMNGAPHPPTPADLAQLRTAMEENADTVYGFVLDEGAGIDAAGGVATWVPGEEAQAFVLNGSATQAAFITRAVPASDKLVLEDASASARQVTVSGENLTLQEALDLIAEESGCNIFRDGTKLVVDYCD